MNISTKYYWKRFLYRYKTTTPPKNGPTQIRTGVPRTRISYAAPTPWDLLII